jgi:hypothetical protein
VSFTPCLKGNYFLIIKQKQMERKDALLKEAANEIRHLRASNESMRDRLYMFDSIMLLVRGRDSSMGGAMHPDLVWEIENFLAKGAAEKEATAN